MRDALRLLDGRHVTRPGYRLQPGAGDPLRGEGGDDHRAEVHAEILGDSLARIATELLRDLEADTVDRVPNYDESTTEPSGEILSPSAVEPRDARTLEHERAQAGTDNGMIIGN